MSWLYGNWRAALGFALGGCLSWASLWAAQKFVGSAVEPEGSKLGAQSKLQLLLLAKLPVFAFVTFFTNSLGMKAISAFLVGYLLVYLLLVFGAFDRSGPPISTDDQ